jgi:anti-sigma regulatory factor (Ser/Thr protein kinase)
MARSFGLPSFETSVSSACLWVTPGLWLSPCFSRWHEALGIMRSRVANRRTDFHAEFGGRRTGSLHEIKASIPSELNAISPLVDRMMRLIEGAHCVAGEQYAVELALREALNNAVVDGNRLNARKLVHIRCRCRVGNGISLVVSEQVEGFDARTVHDPLAAGNLEAEHRPSIQLMKSAMDLVSFERRGTEVHMRKRPVCNPSESRSDSRRC